MESSHQNSVYPRPLSEIERGLIEWILPSARKGYGSCRDRIKAMVVIGEGRRGKGEIILGAAGDKPDFDEPLSPVLAYGAIDTSMGTVSVTLREESRNQISVEIVSQKSDEVPDFFEESRRWTYSTWVPEEPCPQCRGALREVTLEAGGSRSVLAICARDRRLWVYDSGTGVVHLIPLTNYYNELMLHRNIRDPKIALDSKRFFFDLSGYSDAELTRAFLTYNAIKTKVRLEDAAGAAAAPKMRLRERIKKVFTRK